MNPIIKKLNTDIFYISSTTFFTYLGLELLFEGLISNHFDLHILLLVVIASGIMSLILGEKGEM